MYESPESYVTFVVVLPDEWSLLLPRHPQRRARMEPYTAELRTEEPVRPNSSANLVDGAGIPS